MLFLTLLLSGKRRRKSEDFPGANIIVPQIKAKTARKRVGLVSTGPPVRQHTPILSSEGKVIGEKENTVEAAEKSCGASVKEKTKK